MWRCMVAHSVILNISIVLKGVHFQFQVCQKRRDSSADFEKVNNSFNKFNFQQSIIVLLFIIVMLFDGDFT